MAVYNKSGQRIDSGSGGTAINYDATVKSVNHRGYSTVAPENTLPAYKLSKQMGFNYAECDVSFTSDGVAMLLHDSTIDRTSNGSGTLSEMTYDEVRQYDFGSWKSAAYAGTVIPTLAEFLDLCKKIMLHPYIELKDNGGYTQAQIEGIVAMVNEYGLKGKVTYISFSSTYLGYVKNADASARLGFLKSSPTTGDISTITNLQTGTNEVYYGAKYSSLTDAICSSYAAAGIPIEIWTVNTSSAITGANPYVSGITSDSLLAGQILYDSIFG